MRRTPPLRAARSGVLSGSHFGEPQPQLCVGLVLGDHVGGDTAPWRHCDSLADRPFANDRRGGTIARDRTLLIALACERRLSLDLAAPLDELGQRLPQRRRVLLAQVNLEAGAVETKRNSLRCLTTVQIVDQAHGCLLCHWGNLH